MYFFKIFKYLNIFLNHCSQALITLITNSPTNKIKEFWPGDEIQVINKKKSIKNEIKQ